MMRRNNITMLAGSLKCGFSRWLSHNSHDIAICVLTIVGMVVAAAAVWVPMEKRDRASKAYIRYLEEHLPVGSMYSVMNSAEYESYQRAMGTWVE